ncbi:stonustoxin subunit beta-like [Seriola lalandi dorsalis]|uniref:stonustoxin subunit beta-like n=1 Tax=Seriola lalandi dorsalis TaxID=1841481 RepID=UPI000C6FBD39|nr:stonustoxin subunit beta-like [Seriola lalandi dorsalis]
MDLGAAPSLGEETKVKPGEDVTLPCRGPRDAEIKLITWIRPDLKSEDYVFFYREKRLYESNQLPSYRGRVELTDPQVKDGDVSVILKSVTINDAGRYECQVGKKGSRPQVINTITLKVVDSGEFVQVNLSTPGAGLYLGGVHLPGVRKYSCELELDENTVNRKLRLSDDNRTVTFATEVQSYPDHPDRFNIWSQLLCRTGLTGRCYWEVEWRGLVHISVSYRGITSKGDNDDCWFGGNDQSWSLICSDDDDGGRYSVWHNNRKTSISSSSVSHRVAVYVDCPAGSLSFYRVSDSLIHLHTFNTTFTEPLYPGFRTLPGSSVSLCL